MPCLTVFSSFCVFFERLHHLISEAGGCSTGKSFRFVRACVRAVWLPSELDQKLCGPAFSLFPFGPARSWGFYFVGPGGFRERSLFPFGAASFPFSLLVPGSFPFSLEVKNRKVYKV